MAKKVDDKSYWKQRHVERDDISASGHKSLDVKSNRYLYKILLEQYRRLLKQIDFKSQQSVIDCGFGDGIFLKFFSKNYPEVKLYGVDISEVAKSKIDFLPKSRLLISDLSQFKPAQQYDVAHCFDVLYHILDDKDYEASLTNIAKSAKNYVILHERFLRHTPIFMSPHVNLRPVSITDSILSDNGFELASTAPTHFLAMRILTYRLNQSLSKQLYQIDNFIATRLPRSLQNALASHHIRVYRRAIK